jgi:hypothetical protein
MEKIFYPSSKSPLASRRRASHSILIIGYDLGTYCELTRRRLQPVRRVYGPLGRPKKNGRRRWGRPRAHPSNKSTLDRSKRSDRRPLSPGAATLPADGRHVGAILAHQKASLAARGARFFRRELVGCAFEVGCATALGGNLALFLCIHGGKAAKTIVGP